MEPADLWQRYIEPEYRDRCMRIVEVEGVEQLLVEDQVLLTGVLAALGGAAVEREKLFQGGLKYIEGCPPASYDPHERVKLLDEWGVDAGVLFPTIGILPFLSDDMGFLNASCRAYNTWQSEFAGEIPGRVIPIAHLNLRDLDGAIAELERCLDIGFKGVFLPPEPVDGIRPGEARFDPLWERCAEAGVPVCLHVIVRFSGAAIPFAAWHQTPNPPGMIFGFGLGGTGQIIPAAASMVTDGVFDRIPNLKLLCVESGCGWAAYVMDRLDEKWPHFSFTSTLKKRPSDYFRTNLWFVAEPEERTIGCQLDLVGEDRILWGSDYPHVDSTLDAPKLIREALADLPEKRRKAVLGGNAAKVFGLTRAGA